MIRTRRLVLRPVRDEDLEALHAIFSDPAAMRYWSHPAHETLTKTRQTLMNMRTSHSETGLEFVVTLQGEVIGKAGLWRAGEIGYILRSDTWGQGFGTEAVGAVVAAAFDGDPGLAAITAEIDPRNHASAALLTRLGFREVDRIEKAVEIAGEWCDSSFWRLERNDGGSAPLGPSAAA